MKALYILSYLSFLIATFIFAESCTNEEEIELISKNRLYVCYTEKSLENEDKTSRALKNLSNSFMSKNNAHMQVVLLAYVHYFLYFYSIFREICQHNKKHSSLPIIPVYMTRSFPRSTCFAKLMTLQTFLLFTKNLFQNTARIMAEKPKAQSDFLSIYF